MFRKILIAFAGLSVLLAAGAYLSFPSISAAHPALSDALPKLTPLRHFYANADSRWRFRLSPDGARLAWLEAKYLKPALWVRSLGGTTPTYSIPMTKCVGMHGRPTAGSFFIRRTGTGGRTT